MNSDRQVLPAAHGSRPEASDTPAATVLYDLSHLGLIAVRGADATSFLQGQLTNDIRQLSPTRSQLGSHCSPKGRMLALFRIWPLGDAIVLQLPRERLPEALKRLRMYVLRAKATLEDASDAWMRLGIAGDRAAEALAALGLTLPESDGGLAETDGVTVLRLPAPMPRFELIGPGERLSTLWQALRPGSALGDADGWALLDIRAGIPSVHAETVDAFVPQMCNLAQIDGVSFNKGCYTGQEVVARMQYLGRLKRRMYLAEVETATPPRPGDRLDAPTSASEQGAGRIVDARRVAGQRYALLAVAEIEAAQSGQIRLGENGPTLDLQPPPYGFPSEGGPGG